MNSSWASVYSASSIRERHGDVGADRVHVGVDLGHRIAELVQTRDHRDVELIELRLDAVEALVHLDAELLDLLPKLPHLLEDLLVIARMIAEGVDPLHDRDGEEDDPDGVQVRGREADPGAGVHVVDGLRGPSVEIELEGAEVPALAGEVADVRIVVLEEQEAVGVDAGARDRGIVAPTGDVLGRLRQTRGVDPVRERLLERDGVLPRARADGIGPQAAAGGVGEGTVLPRVGQLGEALDDGAQRVDVALDRVREDAHLGEDRVPERGAAGRLELGEGLREGVDDGLDAREAWLAPGRGVGLKPLALEVSDQHPGQRRDIGARDVATEEAEDEQVGEARIVVERADRGEGVGGHAALEGGRAVRRGDLEVEQVRNDGAQIRVRALQRSTREAAAGARAARLQPGAGGGRRIGGDGERARERRAVVDGQWQRVSGGGDQVGHPPEVRVARLEGAEGVVISPDERLGERVARREREKAGGDRDDARARHPRVGDGVGVEVVEGPVAVEIDEVADVVEADALGGADRVEEPGVGFLALDAEIEIRLGGARAGPRGAGVDRGALDLLGVSADQAHEHAGADDEQSVICSIASHGGFLRWSSRPVGSDPSGERSAGRARIPRRVVMFFLSRAGEGVRAASRIARKGPRTPIRGVGLPITPRRGPFPCRILSIQTRPRPRSIS